MTLASISQVAEMAIGYSGAELANLLNEAAILAVRKNQDTIDLRILIEAMDKIKLGLRSAPLPDSTAKRRMAAVEAGRAVVLTLTPGIPTIQHITIQPRGGVMGRILFEPLVRPEAHPVCAPAPRCILSLGWILSKMRCVWAFSGLPRIPLDAKCSSRPVPPTRQERIHLPTYLPNHPHAVNPTYMAR